MAARRRGVAVSRHRKWHDHGYLQLEFTFTSPVVPIEDMGNAPRRARERMHRDDGSETRPKKAQAGGHARRPTRPRERMER
jgi:hypothetical protein